MTLTVNSPTTATTSSPTSTGSSTSTTSPSTLQSLGIGSGLDIASLVSTLTTSEMSAPNAQVTREQADVTAQVSAMATLKSSLSTFQSTLSALSAGSGLAAHLVTSSDNTVFTASTTSTAALGTYGIQVTQLAQSQQLISNNFTGGASAVVGTGTLSVTSGGQSFSITLDSSNNTLAGIRDAINFSPDNSGVSAALVYGQNGAQLVLSSLQTGANSAIQVNATGGNGGLTQLTYGTGNTANYTQQQKPQDAIITVSGVEHHSSSNNVSDAIDGVTLNLLSSKPNTTVSLTIGNDTAHVVSQVQSFVTAYNTLQTSLAPLGSYDTTTQTAGTLFGDPMFTGLQSQIQHALSDSVSGITGTYSSLAAIGVTTNADGSLSLDSNKLQNALNSDFSSVSKVLGSTNGVISRLSSLVDTALASDGSVGTRSANLTTQQSHINDEKAQIALQTAAVSARYLAKFNAMDSFLAQMQNTASYLTQQFNALNKSTNG